ncbi:MAG TPA: glycosyltransferase family 39 protein, partial [Thermoanaerobaculia bacterium]|nr:glycosyltransferase family 39 protein [Thermoanaerobaculia bacterium]
MTERPFYRALGSILPEKSGWLLFGVVAFVALALAYSRLTPLGEAPDEPAHLEYLRLLLETEQIPAVPGSPGEVAYELHQPPLAYALTAAVVRVSQHRRPLPELHRSAEFDFSQPPKRYVDGAVGSRGWWPPRLVSCFWAVLFVPALWSCAGAMVREVSAGSAAFFLVGLTPQVIFSFGTFNNDAAVISLSTLAFALVLESNRRRSDSLLLLAAGFCGLALWAKLTAAFLFFPLMVVATRWPRRRIAAVTGAAWLAMLSALLFYQATRGIPLGHAV